MPIQREVIELNKFSIGWKVQVRAVLTLRRSSACYEIPMCQHSCSVRELVGKIKQKDRASVGQLVPCMVIHKLKVTYYLLDELNAKSFNKITNWLASTSGQRVVA